MKESVLNSKEQSHDRRNYVKGNVVKDNVVEGDLAGRDINRIENIKQQTNTVYNFNSEIQSQRLTYEVVSFDNGDLHSSLEKFSALMNLQVTIHSGNTHFEIPFIQPKNFEELSNINKLLIKGGKGVGKSRCIFEILKANLNSIKNIIIINPALDKAKESTINEIKDIVANDDILIWNDFPRGLSLKDRPDFGLQTLGLLIDLTQRVYLTLDDEYLRSYGSFLNSIIDPKIRSIIFDDKIFKKMLETYGNNILLYQDVYNRFIQPRFSEVATILFEKEPTPQFLLTFFRECLEKKPTGFVNPVIIAKTLKTGIEYYRDLFHFIKNNNPIEANFLYALKLSYDLGQPRNSSYLNDLQKTIFGNNNEIPDLQKVNLDTFVYYSNGQFSMKENLKDVITYPEERLENIFYHFFSKESLDKINQNYSQQILFGTVLGRYYPLTFPEEEILPDHIINFSTNHPGFLSGFSSGLGGVFESIDQDRKRKIWKMVDDSNFLQLSLFSSFGLQYPVLGQETQQKIWERVEKNLSYKIGFAYSIGSVYSSLDKETQSKLWKLAEDDSEFSIRFVPSMFSLFPSLDEETKKKIWLMIDKVIAVAFAIGVAAGGSFPFFDSGTKEYLLLHLHKNRIYCFGFYEGIGLNYLKLDPVLQNHLISHSSEDDFSHSYEKFLGIGLGITFSLSKYEDQIKILDLAEKYNYLLEGLGSSIGFRFDLYENEIKQRILSLSMRDEYFAKTLFVSLGLVFKTFRSSTQNELLKILKNEELAASFASGLGQDLGFIESNFDKVTNWINTYPGFGDGFGIIIGALYGTMSESTRRKLWEIVNDNKIKSEDILFSLGFNFISYAGYNVYSKEILERVSQYKSLDFFDGLLLTLPLVDQNMRNKVLKLLEMNPEHLYLFYDTIIETLTDPNNKEIGIVKLLKDEKFQDLFSRSVGKYLKYMDNSNMEKFLLILSDNHNLKDKIEQYLDTISLEKNDLEELEGKAIFLFYQGSYPEALNIIDQILIKSPSLDLYLAKANCLISIDSATNISKAEEALNQALNFEPNNINTLKSLYDLYQDFSFKYDKAHTIATKLIEIEDSNILKLLLIETLIETMQFEEAIKQSNEILSRSTSNTEKAVINLFLGCAYFLIHNSIKGIEYVIQTLTLLTDKKNILNFPSSNHDSDNLEWYFDGLTNFLNNSDIDIEAKNLLFNLFPHFGSNRNNE
ncbi:MAG: hypothetical protein K0S93_279 [Nitrososphaeraceae archaeon]|jgi:tetratricopeptide (TPR) repeat protein|nr:hypothetical protein [Nitrososphaeraceae archaeon]